MKTDFIGNFYSLKDHSLSKILDLLITKIDLETIYGRIFEKNLMILTLVD